MNSRGHGGTRSLFECGSKEKGEDHRKNKGLQYKIFREILVFVPKFLRFSTNSSVKTKKKFLFNPV